ncbi:hypothetical protein [Hydrogenophaga soli]
MTYILLFWTVLLLTPIAVGAGLIYTLFQAHKRLSRSNFLILVFALVAIPYAAFKNWESNRMLSVVPDALNVSSISYTLEESWGFGPGGNEAGIRTYPLPGSIANDISKRGIDFFINMPPNQNQNSREWRGIYGDWTSTPIRPNDQWKWNEKNARMEIYDYICAYGFCIDIKPEVTEEANAIINSTGSYYAHGRVGIIVVCPSKKLVLYFYNG